ncbi:hypothetical protein A2870_03145 [Candidatus Curtissbacteria bacterium RIFCSPHIGHO2_01_FULL_41_11]|uniref:Uncharacterized protein n=1 Tax=Candidatus Curtissbacteria bacterium RIFCSPHIGHO2_01_FULL_41_11 TaxID=1797711 RepID=A0A1F5G765_9BACT|nr:MAG: hypothetical protein A2870_03145 [Candidatus Curtissbacteria bacterium RIFCSPHIGHO2_01_FULL_41_11]
MHKPVALANAATIVGLGIYVACRVLTLVAPGLVFAVGRSWFHAIELESVQSATPIGIGTFLLGAITLSALIWITFYAFAQVYNRLAK